MNRTFEWGVVIVTFLSSLMTVPRHCAHLQGQLLKSYFPFPSGACGAQEAFPTTALTFLRLVSGC